MDIKGRSSVVEFFKYQLITFNEHFLFLFFWHELSVYDIYSHSILNDATTHFSYPNFYENGHSIINTFRNTLPHKWGKIQNIRQGHKLKFVLCMFHIRKCVFSAFSHIFVPYFAFRRHPNTLDAVIAWVGVKVSISWNLASEIVTFTDMFYTNEYIPSDEVQIDRRNAQIWLFFFLIFLSISLQILN